MPEMDTETGHSSRLLRGLIWAGVLLAPLAAAVVLLGQSSSSVRFAVLLIAVSVVLIGASVLIRNDPVLQRMHVEDRVADEIDTLRRDLRAEFGRGVASGPPPDNSGFFRDAPMAPPADDPFPARPRRTPDPGFANGGRVAAPAPGVGNGGRVAAPAPGSGDGGRVAASDPGFGNGGRVVGSDPGFGSGGRAAVPAPAAAVAAVHPVGPGGGPGPEFDEPSFGRRGPGMTSGPRPVAAAAPIPAPRGAAAVPASPAAPRASATVGPGGVAVGPGGVAVGPGGVAVGPGGGAVGPGGGQYGRSGPPDADFGGSNGHAAARVAGTYGSARVAAPGPNDYGHGPAGGGHGGPAGDGYAQPDGVYGTPSGRAAPNGYDPSNAYDPSNDFGLGNGYRDESYDDYSPGDPDVADYGLDGGYDGPQASGDPDYKARRHRPSANDTNVGTLADFAAYPGWTDEPQPDERYVQGYGPRRR